MFLRQRVSRGAGCSSAHYTACSKIYKTRRGAPARSTTRWDRYRGICMAKKELDAILEAERKAAEVVESAKARAKEILAAADKEAERLLQEAIEDAQSKAKSLLDNASASSDALEKAYLEEAEKEIASLREAAGSRLQDAVQTIVSKVKKAL